MQTKAAFGIQILNRFKINELSFTILRTFSSKSNVPELPQCEFKPTQYKCNLGNVEIERIHKVNLHPSLVPYYKNPVTITQGYMQYVWDSEGKRYLDMFAGIVTTSVGHCHPKLVESLSHQLQKLWHVSSIYLNEEIHEYSNKLANRFPEPLNNIFFCNSGSEANDIAMLMARLYTGAFDIVAVRNGYHGMSPYTMGLCGVGNWKHNIPTSFGIHHTSCPDPYNGRFGGSLCRDSLVQTTRMCDCNPGQCQACDAYIDDLKNLFNTTLPKKIAGFFAESIQGVGGTVQFPKEYLKRAFQMVRERGGLCISDEVQTGFGRMGTHFWGFQGHDVLPDIVTMAKGIGNGFPLAAVITRPEIAKVLSDASYFNTFGGNPLACTVGSKVLDIIDEEKLQQNSKHLGSRLITGLAKLRTQFEDVIGDVRGKGLMIGVELTSDKKNRVPMPKPEVDAILEDCKEMGLLIGKGGGFGNVFRIKPPMCISDADVHFMLKVMEIAFKNHYDRKAKAKY